jgi:Domain of unknown function (DUF1772)
MTVLASVALVNCALFSAGASYVAWVRIPAWRRMSWQEFQSDFARLIRRADLVQPALLVGCLAATVGRTLGSSGTARALSVVAAAGLILILAGSVAVLVPLQRRLIRPGHADLDTLRRWHRGHLARASVAWTCFALLVVAAV